MHTNNMTLETFETFVVRLACGFASAALVLLLVVMSFTGSSFAQDSQPKTFQSPAEASDALYQAAHKQDEQSLEAILGAGKEVTSSANEEEDKLEREQFCKKYREMHRLVREADGTTVLYIGAENWPFPVPLVQKNGVWHFDSKTGVEEIKFRRIGENETAAIEVCNAFATAKKQGETSTADDGDWSSQYAQRLVAASTTNAESNDSAPFHGYYFRIVKESSAPAMSGYVSGAKKKGKLVLVAYPADYRSSGVKTFVVTQDGAVYEKDLGPSTATVAPQLKTSTGSSWRPPE